MVSLGPLYCHLPDPVNRCFRFLTRHNLPLLETICYAAGRAYTAYRIATRIFRPSLPRSPWLAIRLLVFAVRRMT